MLSRSPSPTRPAGFIAPCLPTLARAVPDGALWVHEIKHDGFRFVCRRAGDRVRVFSRHGKDWSERVPAIVEAMLALPVTSATIDGEGVVVDERGVTDFERLRSALASGGFARGFPVRLRLARTRRRRRASASLGNPPGRLDPDCCARRAPVSACPSISTVTARLSSATLARLALRASSQSAAIGRTDPVGPPIG